MLADDVFTVCCHHRWRRWVTLDWQSKMFHSFLLLGAESHPDKDAKLMVVVKMLRFGCGSSSGSVYWGSKLERNLILFIKKKFVYSWDCLKDRWIIMNVIFQFIKYISNNLDYFRCIIKAYKVANRWHERVFSATPILSKQSATVGRKTASQRKIRKKLNFSGTTTIREQGDKHWNIC